MTRGLVNVNVYIRTIHYPLNSLQTGRTFRTRTTTKRTRRIVVFQFPSNGKDFPNVLATFGMAGCDEVSIPFKREGLSERVVTASEPEEETFVSIPFKREGLSELIYIYFIFRFANWFQFPSNGKADSNSK